MIDVERLLTEIAPDAPCGPDLVYDPAFMGLEQAARGRPEQQFGETTLAAAEPDWNDVQERAVALLARSKDLRVALTLARAWLRLDHVEGLAAGMRLVQGLLERFWDHVHPGLDADDGLDPTMRLNALAMLGDPETLLRDARNACLVRPGRHGTLAVRNVLAALGKWTAGDGEAVLRLSEIENMLRAVVEAEGTAVVDALRTSVRSVDAMRALLAEKVGTDQVPDIEALRDLLASVLQVCDGALGTTAEVPAPEVAGGPETGQASVPHSTGDIRSREDAVRALQRVTEFIERTEPANPAPLFIRRAQRLMAMSFAEIIQDLVPESLGQIQKLAGLESEQ